jgi:hypothetical protein
MLALKQLINQLESKINDFESTNLEVSKSTVGWQIDHSLRVINGVISLLKKSNPEDYKWKFNFPRTVVFFINRIPRGKANAPKNVQSSDEILKQDLQNQIEISKTLVLDLEKLHKKSNFKHPYFDILNLKQTIKFLNIHTNHHLKVINDILK